jgi:hypothetical protein
MASSSRRVFIGYLVLAKAVKAGGDQTTPSRPPLTATSMIGNSGAPLEHLASVTACKTAGLGLGAESASRPGTYFFRKWGRGGRGPGASPGVPNPPPGPRPTAAPGGWRRRAREGGALHRPYYALCLVYNPVRALGMGCVYVYVYRRRCAYLVLGSYYMRALLSWYLAATTCARCYLGTWQLLHARAAIREVATSY